MNECNCPKDQDGKRIGGSSNCPVHALAPGGGAGGNVHHTSIVEFVYHDENGNEIRRTTKIPGSEVKPEGNA